MTDKSKKIALVVVVLAIAGVVAYFLFFSTPQTPEEIAAAQAAAAGGAAATGAAKAIQAGSTAAGGAAAAGTTATTNASVANTSAGPDVTVLREEAIAIPDVVFPNEGTPVKYYPSNEINVPGIGIVGIVTNYDVNPMGKRGFAAAGNAYYNIDGLQYGKNTRTFQGVSAQLNAR